MALPRERRLRSARRIALVSRTGRHAGGSIGRLSALPRDDPGPTRLACSAGRRLGSAVRRNRCRRRAQAAFVALTGRIAEGLDLVLRAGPGLEQLEFAELRAELERLLGQVGGLREPEAT